MGAMNPTRIGPLGVRSLGRGEPGGPAILLCHGFGAGGDDLVPLGRAVDLRGVRWFFPEGPIGIDFGGGMSGRAWWEIDMERLMEMRMRGEADALAEETPPGLAPARAALEATIAELEAKHDVARDKLVIGGFSQGAMVTTEIALHATKPFAGLVALSGTVLSRARWQAAAKSNGKDIHALVTHGRADPLLPFEGGEALRDLLQAGGATVTWIAHRGAHEIPPPALDGLATFARARLGV
jgi:phospholipase/carboxylesterase